MNTPTRRPRAGAGIAAACLGLAAAAVILRLTGVWPCPTSCQGGAAFERVLGVSVLYPALGVYLLGLGAGCGPGGAWARTLLGVSLGLAGGAALFHLAVAAGLGLVCGFCFLVHGLALGAVIAWSRGDGPGRAGLRRSAFVAGATVLLLVAGHGRTLLTLVAHDEAAPVRVVTTVEGTSQEEMDLRIDAGRTIGSVTCPVLVELALSPTCPRCAELAPALLAEADRAAQAGRAQTIIRLRIHRGEPAAQVVGGWLLAAARESPARFRLVLMETGGIRADLGRMDLLQRFPDCHDLDEAADSADITPTLRADQQRLRILGIDQESPAAAILRRTGRRTGGGANPVLRLSGTFTADNLADAIDRAGIQPAR